MSEVAAPYIRGSETSKAAALAIEHDLNRLESIVLALIREREEGVTDEQMQGLLGMNPNTQRPRRIALVARGLVRDSGEKRRTWAGRWATVWEAA